MRRTKAQRKWIRRGYPREMIPMKAQDSGLRYAYPLHASANWRDQRELARLMHMPIRPICKQFLDNGRKP